MAGVEVLAGFGSDELRGAEAAAREGRSDDVLMLRAAAGLAVECARVLRTRFGGVSGRRVVLLAGSGNNGGDALLAGARLRERGAAVTAVLTAETAYQPGVDALRAAGGRMLTIGEKHQARTAVAGADLVLDGVVGLGGSPGLPAGVADLLRVIPSSAVLVAVDLPSGVEPMTGETPAEHVRADLTVTFGAWKPAVLVPPAAYSAGAVVLVDVGLGPHLPAGEPAWRRLTPQGVAARWPVPARRDHKYRRGVLGVVAGSDTYPGAAVLACAGAVRSGVGIVRYVGPPAATAQVLGARPEVVPGVGRVQAWLLGSGVQDDPEQDAAIETALESGLPCVVDAGALEACVRRRADGARAAGGDRVLLTPHAGELARMLGLLGEPTEREEVEARPLHYGRRLAAAVDATVLVKGSITLIVAPDGRVTSQDDGPPWLAAAGSGDVLAGAAGALLAGGTAAADAGAMAVVVNGLAAQWASSGGPLAALDTAEAIPAVLADLLRSAGRAQSWRSGRPAGGR